MTGHELLLRATLAPEPEARDAFAAWRAQADLATLDRASQRVLSLLAERLDGQDDEVAAKVRRIARFTWLRTQVLLERTAPAVRALAESGVPVLLIKGAAVLAHTGWRVARRPMDDLDLAVPRLLAPQAIAVLGELGFTSPLASDPRHLDERHALPFRDSAGAELDLHWHVLHSSLHRDADRDFWAAAVPAHVRDVECLALCREDALLQACTQGREYSETHPLRWAADAAELLRGAEAFDWDRVVMQARRHRLARELGEALTVLAEVTGEPIPPAGLRKRAPRLVARRAEESSGDGPLAPRAADRLGDELRDWVRREVAPGTRVTPKHAALWLKQTWALPRVRDIPRHVLRGVDDPTPETTVALRRGDVLGFRHGEAGTSCLGAGWWAPDEHGTWSRGRETVLVLPLAGAEPAALTLAIDLVPFLTPTRPHLEVRVSVDGEQRQRWGFSGTTLADTRRVVRVPACEGRDRIALRFAVRHPLSPLAARHDGDPRPLGIALRGLSVA
jgi:hypothetical protein